MGTSKKRRKLKKQVQNSRPVAQTSRQQGLAQGLSPAEINRAEAREYQRLKEQIQNADLNGGQARPRQDTPASPAKQAPVPQKRQRTPADKNRRRVREQARQANAKRHRKRRKRNYKLYLFLLLLMMIITGITLSVTVFFNIEQIVVYGTDLYGVQEVSKITGVGAGDNLFRLNLTKMEQQMLEKCIDLDSVSIKRRLPQELVVNMVPADPEMLLEYNERFYVLSSGGRLIQVVDSVEGYEHLLQISGVELGGMEVGQFIEKNEDFSHVTGLIRMLEDKQIGPLCGIEFSQVEIKLNLDNRIAVLLGTMIELDTKLDMVKTVLNENIGSSERAILDASVTGKTYHRPLNDQSFLPRGMQTPDTQEEAGGQAGSDD